MLYECKYEVNACTKGDLLQQTACMQHLPISCRHIMLTISILHAVCRLTIQLSRRNASALLRCPACSQAATSTVHLRKRLCNQQTSITLHVYYCGNGLLSPVDCTVRSLSCSLSSPIMMLFHLSLLYFTSVLYQGLPVPDYSSSPVQSSSLSVQSDPACQSGQGLRGDRVLCRLCRSWCENILA